eukprot:TRINITY_DN61745_c0_g1_i1.p1 TRINITY_DN61745_c0_g1~~TRINITY_DN61745_c0_g1_i1.p1  ORF type:complete len:298 (+),score=7.48 TRINITY_DN61745_c0_g1_i1:410-1303(+)
MHHHPSKRPPTKMRPQLQAAGLCLLLLLGSAAATDMKGKSSFVPALASSAAILQDGGTVTTQAAGRTPRYVNVGARVSGFTYTFNPSVNFASWAATTKVNDGDYLVFQFPKRTDEVYQFARQADYEICNYPRATLVCKNWEGEKGCKVRATAGTMFFASGMLGRCMRSQKVAVRVLKKMYVPRNVVVGRPTASFSWPWNPQVDYRTWLANTKVYVGDKLVFKYAAYMDEVYIVPTYNDFMSCKYDNYLAYCNATDGVGDGCFSSAITASPTYFVSGSYSHCFANNQRIAVKGLPPPS